MNVLLRFKLSRASRPLTRKSRQFSGNNQNDKHLLTFNNLEYSHKNSFLFIFIKENYVQS